MVLCINKSNIYKLSNTIVNDIKLITGFHIIKPPAVPITAQSCSIYANSSLVEVLIRVSILDSSFFFKLYIMKWYIFKRLISPYSHVVISCSIVSTCSSLIEGNLSNKLFTCSILSFNSSGNSISASLTNS